jgi:hypothetical protein
MPIFCPWRVTRGFHFQANLMFDEITVSTQLVSIGYLWCQVFPSENLHQLGVPTAAALQEADELKVADLQELSSVTFAELDAGTIGTWDIDPRPFFSPLNWYSNSLNPWFIAYGIYRSLGYKPTAKWGDRVAPCRPQCIPST